MQLSRQILSGRDEKALIYASPGSVLQESTKKLVYPKNALMTGMGKWILVRHSFDLAYGSIFRSSRVITFPDAAFSTNTQALKLCPQLKK